MAECKCCLILDYLCYKIRIAWRIPTPIVLVQLEEGLFQEVRKVEMDSLSLEETIAVTKTKHATVLTVAIIVRNFLLDL
jgi:hypothetical protein